MNNNIVAYQNKNKEMVIDIFKANTFSNYKSKIIIDLMMLQVLHKY